MKNLNNQKIIVILGPTASGKSALAINLALRFSSGQAKKKLGINGAEVISADSRQVYRGMDIGSGKVTKKEMRGIPHYLLDIADPKKIFTVSQYKNLAEKALNKIIKNKKTPIICGGTGFYIQALVDGLILPQVAPNWQLRTILEKKSPEELFKILSRIDPERAKTIDRKNPRRLIRAIEIIKKTKGVVPKLGKKPLPYPVLFIGIEKSPEELKKLIHKRLVKRLKIGMLDEIKKLHKSGVSWKRLEEFGLEYRYIALYLQKKLEYHEMIEKLQKEIEHYAKRQMTWFKRDKRIEWIKSYQKAEKLVKRFL